MATENTVTENTAERMVSVNNQLQQNVKQKNETIYT